MNIELLREIEKHYQDDPRRLYMPCFVVAANLTERPKEMRPPCGTVACIAGTALLLSGQYIVGTNVFDRAANLLDLDREQAVRLFFLCEWPPQFWVGAMSDGEESTAQLCVARIEHFIKTEGAE